MICLSCNAEREFSETPSALIHQEYKGMNLFVFAPAMECGQCGWITAGLHQVDELRRRTEVLYRTIRNRPVKLHLTQVEDVQMENRNLRARIGTMEGIIRKLQKADEWLPGQWLCKECGFSLTKSVMYMGNGVIGADKSPLNEICPNDGSLMTPMTFEVGFRSAQKAFDSWIPVIEKGREAAEKHDKVTEMVSRFCVAWKSELPESWMDGFVECGAITIDPNYPYGFIAPVYLTKEPPKP